MGRMESQAQLWNQYHSLREEIRGADSLNSQIMGIVVGAVAVLLTTAIKENEPLVRSLVFMCVYVVTVPGYRLLRGNRLRIWRISTYLRVFIEPELDFVKWETRLTSQREDPDLDPRERDGFSTLVSASEWAIISLVNTLAALGAILSLLYKPDATLNEKIGGVAVVVTINLSVMFWTLRQERALRRQGDVEKRFLRSWQKLRTKEAQTPSEPRRPNPSTPAEA
jgi:hypothetical protein